MKSKMFALALVAAAGTAFAQNSIVNNLPGTFVDISALGANTLINGTAQDDTSFPITTSVTNTVFASTNVRICTNGFIQFGAATGATTWTNATIAAGTNSPLAPTSAQALMPFWDDQNIPAGNGGEIYWMEGPAASFGLPASRGNVLIIQWNNVPHYDATLTPAARDAGTYQVQIFQNVVGSVAAQMLYSDVNYGLASMDDGASATIGYAAGTTGGPGSSSNVLYSFNTAGSVTTGTVLSVMANTAPVPPTAVGTSTPGSVEPGNQVVYTVTVTPGANPVSTGIVVRGDLSAVSGPNNALFHDDGLNGDAAAGDMVYSYSYLIPAATGGGNYTVPVTITDAQGRNAAINVVGNVFNPEDLGTLVDGTNVNRSVDVDAFEIEWFKVTVAEASSGAERRLTISTFGTPAPNDDAELGLYDASGNLVANNDDREIFAGPARLSFGVEAENGDLAAGTYYIALGNFNTIYSATGFGAVADLTIAQTALTHQLDILQQHIDPPVIWSENDNGGGDAGDLREIAQTVSGTGQINRITGDVTANDVDMYRVNICDSANFSATTVGNGNTADTRLFLFNTDGTGVVYNDDAVGVGGSTINAASGLIPGDGEYFLAVTRYNVMASDEGGNNIWNTGAPFTGQFAPNGTGAGGTVAQWTGAAVNQAFATYTIAMTGVCASNGGGACSVADVGVAGGLPGQDRLLDNNDFIAFINFFFAQNAAADMGIAGGLPGQDGLFDNNDFIAFISHFFNDSVNCHG